MKISIQAEYSKYTLVPAKLGTIVEIPARVSRAQKIAPFLADDEGAILITSDEILLYASQII